MNFFKNCFGSWKVNLTLICRNICKENNFFKDQLGEWYSNLHWYKVLCE